MLNYQGDARTATEGEVLDTLGAAKNENVYLGRFYDAEKKQAPAEIRYSGDRHVLVFGPTGSGKGRRFLFPNLLMGLENQSVIVIDPKGEAAAITAEARRRMGHDVVILNPFNVRNLGSAGFNPLAGLDPDQPNFFDDAAAVGEALIKPEGKDPHWSESAQGLVVALAMREKQRNGDNANLVNVRKLLTTANEYESYADDEGKMRRRAVAGLRVTAAEMVARGGEVIASLAARFTEDTREIASIQSTADTQTRWILSQPVREDLSRGGVDFARLKEKPTTVYVILPAERLRTHSTWLRLVIVSALKALYKPGGLRTTMFIDEMAALGHLGPLEDAFALVRGYNVQIVGIIQDLSQLKALYQERWETFIANAGVVFGFAPNDLTTADWMSRRSGQTTIVAKGFSESAGVNFSDKTSRNTGTGLSEQQIARPLYLPHELIGFETGMGILWLAGLAHGARFFAPDYSMIKACKSAASET